MACIAAYGTARPRAWAHGLQLPWGSGSLQGVHPAEGARLSGSRVSSAPHCPPATSLPSAEALGHAFQCCQETVSCGHWGVFIVGGPRASGVGACLSRQQSQPLCSVGLRTKPHSDHPSASLCKVLQAICPLTSVPLPHVGRLSPVPTLLISCRASFPSPGPSPLLVDHMVLGLLCPGYRLRAAGPHVRL